MTPANRTPYLIDRTPRQIFPLLVANFTVFLQLSRPSPPGALGYPRGQSPPGTLGATGEGLDSQKDSETGY